MKKIFVVVILLFSLNVNTLAYPSVSAKSAILIEQSTRKILYGKNENAIMKPASTTKILTAICAIEEGNLDDVVEVSDNAVRTEGSSMYLGYNDRITLRNLLYGLMLNSGNDASVAISEHISKTTENFASLMNKKAKKIGAANSNFTNPSGLDSEAHFVTAKDLSYITAYALDNPVFSEIVKTKNKVVLTEDGTKKYLTNHNKMLNMYEGCIGVKTGFTKASGRTLVTAAERNGVKLIAVTLSAPNDWQDHKSMLDYGFQLVSVKNILKREIAGKSKVENGVEEFVEVICDNEYNDISFDKNDKYNVKYDIKNAKSPVVKGEILGKAIVYKNNKVVYKCNLRAVKDVEKIVKKYSLFDYFKRLFLYD